MPESLFSGHRIFGNETSAWLSAALVVLIILGALLVVRRLFLTRAAKRAIALGHKDESFLVQLLNRTHPLFLLLIALLAGSYALELSTEVRGHLRTIATTGLIIQAAFWGNALVNFLSRRYAERQNGGQATVIAVTFLGRLVLWTILVLLLLDTFGVQITTLIATLGVGGIAVALAAQSVLGDLLAAISIYLDKPFIIGDFIIFDDFLGTVEHVGLRSTHIRSLTGERIVMPNSDLLNSRIRNYQHMRERRAVFEFGVAYGLDPSTLESVSVIVREAIEAQALARFDRAHLKSFGESAIKFEAVYYVLKPGYNEYMDTQQAINLTIYKRFASLGIPFGHPVRHVSVTEAQSRAR